MGTGLHKTLLAVAIFIGIGLGSQITETGALVLDHPNPQAGANFGATLADVGDINGDATPDLLVGAPLQDVGGKADQGQAYVLSGTDGSLLLTLDNPNPQISAEFGSALAGAGDINGDGKPDLLIGAPNQDLGPCEVGDTSGCSVGQAYVLSGADGSLITSLNHPAPRAGSFFGSAVASSGDLTGDAIPELIIGAPGQNIGIFVPSQVFIFDGATGTLLLTLDDPNPAEVESLVGQSFGSVVASPGDLDGDSVPDVLVGDAQQDVGGNTDQGQVSIFSGNDGSLLFSVNHPAPQANALFGASASPVEDLNADGIPDIIIGAPQQAVAGNSRQGQAFVFSGLDGSLLLTLDNPTPQAHAHFGTSVASINDVDGDGTPDIIVGAPGEDVEGNPGQGQAHVFSGATGALLFTFDNPNPQANASFGSTVASVGDLDGDGVPDPLVAAPLQDVGTNPLQGQVSSPTPTAANQPPIANAGVDQTVNEGTMVNLDGSASSDPDGDPITFSWTQTAGPAVTLSNPISPTPTFTAPQVTATTALTFQLTVNDGQIDSDPDTVTISVLDVPDGPDLTGTFTKLDLSSGSKGDSLNFTLSVTNIGNKATRGGFRVDFYLSEDSTFDLLDSLVFSKTLKDKGSEGKIQPGSSITISKTLNLGKAGQAQFLIAVIDSKNTIPETDEANNITSGQFTVLPPPSLNRAPTADAGVDQTVNEGTMVNLDGSGSSDPDGDPFTFSWTQTAGPTVVLTAPSSPAPSFTAPQVTSDTTLTFQLIVNDGQLDSNADLVNVTVLDVSEQPTPTTEVCTTKVQAMLLKYIGGSNISGARVEIIADRFKDSPVVYNSVDLVSGVTILSSPAENGFTIDATAHKQKELGSKTKIRINGVEEKLHTSCSTPFEAQKPAPLDKPKGDPSPNWFVVEFTQK